MGGLGRRADDGSVVTVFYTAAGRRGERQRTFVQRIAQATARVVVDDGGIQLTDWSDHREAVQADGVLYLRDEEEHGEPSFIKAFRDPFFFRDPASAREYLLFTGSLATAETEFNGAIGIAEALDDDWSCWSLLPPLLHADGVNNEKAPHVCAFSFRPTCSSLNVHWRWSLDGAFRSRTRSAEC